MSKVVNYVKLHQPIFAPGVGNLKDTLTAEATGVSRDLVMTLEDNMVKASLKGVEILIPLTSISHMVLAKDVKKN